MAGRRGGPGEAPAARLQQLYRGLLDPLRLAPAPPGPAAPAGPGPPAPPPQRLAAELSRRLAEVRGEAAGPARQALAALVLAEAGRAWAEASEAPPEPALSPAQNRALRHRLARYLGLAARRLLGHYLRRAAPQPRPALPEAARLQALVAQLTLDCASLLDAHTVRHHLVTHLRASRARRGRLDRGRAAPAAVPRRVPRGRLGLTIHQLIQLSEPRSPCPWRRMARELQELAAIPPLDLGRAYALLPAAVSSAELHRQRAPGTAGSVPRPAAPQQPPRLARSRSLPSLRDGRRLTDELGLHPVPRPLTPIVSHNLLECLPSTPRRALVLLTRDLHQLSHQPRCYWGRDTEDAEMPPLLAALTRRQANEDRLQQLQGMLARLEAEEAAERQRRRQAAVSVPPTTHGGLCPSLEAQPAPPQLPGSVPADLLCYGPLYNDMLGEIDAATVQQLDADLIAGTEEREIYAELMKDLFSQPPSFDLGRVVVPAPPGLDLSGYLASRTLGRCKEEQVVNMELSRVLADGALSPEGVPVLEPPLQRAGAWRQWWETTMLPDEYLKFLAVQDSDFLHVIFQLYDSKSCLLPALEPALQAPLSPLPLQRDPTRHAPITQPEEHVPGLWDATSALVDQSQECQPEDLGPLQRRLERLWTALRFPDREKLDMAVKYSSGRARAQLPAALYAWEQAAKAIQERELLLAELEALEQAASDPNRFFARVPAAFVARAWEARMRSRLQAAMAPHEAELRTLLPRIWRRFGDTVTYRGRPYLEKLRWDKVEMLYWLQQERRARCLGRGGRLPRLPPLAQVGGGTALPPSPQ